MFAFDLVRVEFADGLGRRWKGPLIDAGHIGVTVPEPKRFPQRLSLHKNLLRASAQRLGQDSPTQVVTRRPQPPLVPCALHKTPQFLPLGRFHAPPFACARVRPASRHHAFVYLREAERFLLIP